MPTVTLSADDWRFALDLARDRAVESLRQDRRDRLFEKSWVDAHAVHIWGAIGEVAFAKFMGVYPEFSVKRFSGMVGDVLGDVEVRHRSKTYYDLIVRPNDSDDSRYVLTLGSPPEITVVGWCYGHEAKQDAYRNDHGGHGAAFFVPQSSLRSVEELKP